MWGFQIAPFADIKGAIRDFLIMSIRDTLTLPVHGAASHLHIIMPFFNEVQKGRK